MSGQNSREEFNITSQSDQTDFKNSSEDKQKPGMASEQRRRQLLRDRFQDLKQMVPQLQTSDKQNKSEAVILQKTVDYLNELIDRRNQLRESIKELNSKLQQPNSIIDSDYED